MADTRQAIEDVLAAERPDMTPGERYRRACDVVSKQPAPPFKTLAVWAMLEGEFEWEVETGALRRVGGALSSDERMQAIADWMKRQEE